jgi:hypothetical protein
VQKEWNTFVDTFQIVPFTARNLTEIVLSDNWSGVNPSKLPPQSDLHAGSNSVGQQLKLQEEHTSDIGCANSEEVKEVVSPGTLRRMRSYEVEFRIEYDDLEISPDKVGDGGYGTVYKGIWKTGHIVCAIKLLNQHAGDSSSSDEAASDHEDADNFAGTPRDDFERETALLRELHHPNLVVCYGMCQGGPGVP